MLTANFAGLNVAIRESVFELNSEIKMKKGSPFVVCEVGANTPVCLPKESCGLGKNKPIRYATKKKALEKAKQLNDFFGEEKFSIRIDDKDIAANVSWREREKKRFERGEYKETNFNKSPLYKANKTNHFLHASKSFPGKVAYVKDDVDGISNKKTVTTMEKYLSKFYKKYLNQRQIEEFAEIFKAQNIGFDKVFFLATTYDEIKRVYSTGPSSCMSGYSGAADERNPAEFYGGGDLAVAYLINTGKVICARTVCWPKKKVYGRVYGTSQRMKTIIELLGYKQASKFSGARVSLRAPNKGNTAKNRVSNITIPENIISNLGLSMKNLNNFSPCKDGNGVRITYMLPYLDSPMKASFDLNTLQFVDELTLTVKLKY